MHERIVEVLTVGTEPQDLDAITTHLRPDHFNYSTLLPKTTSPVGNTENLPILVASFRKYKAIISGCYSDAKLKIGSFLAAFLRFSR